MGGLIPWKKARRRRAIDAGEPRNCDGGAMGDTRFHELLSKFESTAELITEAALLPYRAGKEELSEV